MRISQGLGVGFQLIFYFHFSIICLQLFRNFSFWKHSTKKNRLFLNHIKINKSSCINSHANTLVNLNMKKILLSFVIYQNFFENKIKNAWCLFLKKIIEHSTQNIIKNNVMYRNAKSRRCNTYFQRHMLQILVTFCWQLKILRIASCTRISWDFYSTEFHKFCYLLGLSHFSAVIKNPLDKKSSFPLRAERIKKSINCWTVIS